MMHQQFNIQQLYVLPTLYLCVLYLFPEKMDVTFFVSFSIKLPDFVKCSLPYQQLLHLTNLVFIVVPKIYFNFNYGLQVNLCEFGTLWMWLSYQNITSLQSYWFVLLLSLLNNKMVKFMCMLWRLIRGMDVWPHWLSALTLYQGEWMLE